MSESHIYEIGRQQVLGKRMMRVSYTNLLGHARINRIRNMLEDIVWDDFSVSDNHLVPHPKIELNEGSCVLTESHKKPKHELGMTSNTGRHEAEHVNVATEKIWFSSPKIKSEPMLVNGSLSQCQSAFQTYDDMMTSLSSEGQTIGSGPFMSNNDFYTGDHTPTKNCTTADNNISYSLSDAPQSESDLSFLYNGFEYKETDDPSFYEWPEIGNFEDVDQMLRTCDSAFGLGDSVKEDELYWFSSLTAINGCDAASRSDGRSSYSDSSILKILSENSESTRPNYERPAVDAFNKRSAGASYSSSTLASNTTDQSCHSKAFSVSELPTSSDILDRSKPLKKESSNKNSQSNEISLEDTSFRQLQEVMEQLDPNTKLCIRDSLYRLARSAEQRHDAATIHHVSNADKNSSQAMYGGLISIETDTNPIDRSIAHLLFHRPTDQFLKPLSNTRLAHNLDYWGEDMFGLDNLKVGKGVKTFPGTSQSSICGNIYF